MGMKILDGMDMREGISHPRVHFIMPIGNGNIILNLWLHYSLYPYHHAFNQYLLYMSPMPLHVLKTNSV